MQSSQPAPIARDDTLFGVCEALGEDFGFNPIYLRLTLGVVLLLNPIAVIGGYFAVGAIVILSRLFAPNPRLAAAPEAGAQLETAAEPAPAAAEAVDQYLLPIAA